MELTNLSDYKEKKITEIEDKAYDRLGIIKAGEDVYLNPIWTYISCSSEVDSLMNEELKIETNELLEDYAIVEIHRVVKMEGSKVTITLVDIKEDGMVVLEIYNMCEDQGFLIETNMGDCTDEHIRIFTGVIASAITIPKVPVTFYKLLQFKDVENMVK